MNNEADFDSEYDMHIPFWDETIDAYSYINVPPHAVSAYESYMQHTQHFIDLILDTL